MNSLHTKLKELRELARTSPIKINVKVPALISALEKACEALEFYTAENADFTAGLEMPVPCSKEDVVRVGTKAKEALAEIAAMLEKD